MTVREFVDEYNKCKTDSLKDQFFKSHVKTKYINYAKKIGICEEIISRSMHKEINGEKVFYINTPSRYMLYIVSIVETYMDIKLDPESFLAEFDLIEEYSIGLMLINYVEDCGIFETVLKMMVEDKIDSERNIINWLDSKVEALKLTLDSTTDTLSPLISQLGNIEKN
jgi:hypothetical protein